MKKLETIEQNLPSIDTTLGALLDSTDKLDKSLGGINERIAILESCAIHDNQTQRISELEEAMGTLGSTFSSIKFREKAYVENEQRFMYVSKGPKPKSYYRPKIDKALKTTIDKRASKMPNEINFENDVDTSSLDNT